MMIPFDNSKLPSSSAIDSKRESAMNNKLSMGGNGPVSERSKKIVY